MTFHDHLTVLRRVDPAACEQAGREAAERWHATATPLADISDAIIEALQTELRVQVLKAWQKGHTQEEFRAITVGVLAVATAAFHDRRLELLAVTSGGRA